MSGSQRQATIDLTAFTDLTAVTSRAWEIVKEQSYPKLSLEFSTRERHPTICPGTLVSINHSDYGLIGVVFRILTVAPADSDSLLVTYTAVQAVEYVFDAHFVDPDSTVWVAPVTAPTPFIYTHVLELPWMGGAIGKLAAYLVLGGTEGSETMFSVATSADDATYFNQKTVVLDCKYGVLARTYDVTMEIDDTIGILITPQAVTIQNFSTLLDRSSLFSQPRYALIGYEIIAFQTVTAVAGGSYYYLSNCIRGMFDSVIVEHPVGNSIWLFTLSDNYIYASSTTSYLKLLPGTSTSQISASSASSIAVSPTNIAATPFSIENIQATRVDSLVTILWWPRTKSYTGAGGSSELSINDSSPFPTDVTFNYRINGGSPIATSSTTVTVSTAASFTVEVQAIDGSYISAYSSALTVGTDNGRYLLGIGLVTY
jgi:hypothetical protein